MAKAEDEKVQKRVMQTARGTRKKGGSKRRPAADLIPQSRRMDHSLLGGAAPGAKESDPPPATATAPAPASPPAASVLPEMSDEEVLAIQGDELEPGPARDAGFRRSVLPGGNTRYADGRGNFAEFEGTRTPGGGTFSVMPGAASGQPGYASMSSEEKVAANAAQYKANNEAVLRVMNTRRVLEGSPPVGTRRKSSGPNQAELRSQERRDSLISEYQSAMSQLGDDIRRGRVSEKRGDTLAGVLGNFYESALGAEQPAARVLPTATKAAKAPAVPKPAAKKGMEQTTIELEGQDGELVSLSATFDKDTGTYRYSRKIESALESVRAGTMSVADFVSAFGFEPGSLQ